MERPAPYQLPGRLTCLVCIGKLLAGVTHGRKSLGPEPVRTPEGAVVPGSYLALHQQGELARRAKAAKQLLSPCSLCPRRCQVDRLGGELGTCNTGLLARVSSVHPHFGEEDVLVGSRGSGTIFFCGCNLNCDFCQNWEISQTPEGREVKTQELADLFLYIQKLGCHNLNLVTPSHVVAQILEALDLAADKGMQLPVVYNSGGYESKETLELLEGVVDIYMPDLKFLDPEPAKRFCQAADYPERAKAAVLEMHRQVGDLQVDQPGVALRGLLVRHLVLPENLAGSQKVADFLAGISPHTFINVMAQYRPCHRADRHPELCRRITQQELLAAVQAMQAAGLSRLDGLWPLR